MTELTEKDKIENWFWLAERTVGFLNFLRKYNPEFDIIYSQAQKQLEYARQDHSKINSQDAPQ